jgi:hypothetical protein
MIDWFTVTVATLATVAVTCFMGAVYLWGKHLQRNILLKDGSFIGEYLERYCNETHTPIEKVVLVAHDLGDNVTVYQVQHMDMYPEIWMEEHE